MLSWKKTISILSLVGLALGLSYALDFDEGPHPEHSKYQLPCTVVTVITIDRKEVISKRCFETGKVDDKGNTISTPDRIWACIRPVFGQAFVSWEKELTEKEQAYLIGHEVRHQIDHYCLKEKKTNGRSD